MSLCVTSMTCLFGKGDAKVCRFCIHVRNWTAFKAAVQNGAHTFEEDAARPRGRTTETEATNTPGTADESEFGEFGDEKKRRGVRVW